MTSSLRSTLSLVIGTSAALCLLGAAAPTTLAAPANSTAVVESVDFETKVWPIIERSCLQCHDSGTAFSNLRLDSPEKILAGGDLGKVVVAGEPENSPLVLRVALPMDDLDFMPIEGDPLTEEEIELMKTWIKEGASFGDWKGVE